MDLSEITHRTRELLASLPKGVTLVAAAKGRTPEEVRAAIEGGVAAVGHNYVQEAEASIAAVGRGIQWHFLGHLQRNKARRAAELFDRIETVDSLKLGQALDRACGELGKTLPVFIEVNSGREPNKAGAMPEAVEPLLQELSRLPHLQIKGLMTMGPALPDPEGLRPCFRETRALFERLKNEKPGGVELLQLSMGMSDSFRIAIEEGATEVRVGTHLFGPR